MNKKIKIYEELVVAVLVSDIFQSRKKALIEDLDYETYCLVQKNNYGVTIPINYVTESGLFGLSK